MRVTKFVHSCVLVEGSGATVLIDPGQMSWESGLFKIEALKRLDAIAITHEHFDHFHPPFMQALLQKFPDVTIISTKNVVEKLHQGGAKNATTESTEHVQVLAWPHESMAPLVSGPMDENIGVHVLGVFTHPGDSLQASESKSIFAMPLAGPWGAAIEGIRLAEKLKPKYILPIHDWMWNEEWRMSMHERSAAYFENLGTQSLKPVDGQPIEIEL